MEILTAGVRIAHRSDVAEWRRRVAALAERAGLDETATARVALVVTELGTNLVKHAGGGWGYASAREGRPGHGVDVLTVDGGPGIADLGRALGDGYSTAGTPGTGIGAVRRQSACFDVFTQAGRGTVVAARVAGDGSRRSSVDTPRVRAYAAPAPGETICGDACAARRDGSVTKILVADGLGHGPEAARASRAAIEEFAASPAASPAASVEAIHRALARTRGAAVAVGWLVPERGVVRFAGIGNISAFVVGLDRSSSMVSRNGTAGYAVRSIQEYEYEAPPGSLVLMHSDGLRHRWDLQDYAGLAHRDPALVLGVLLRDFTRGRDDVTVLGVRLPEEGDGP